MLDMVHNLEENPPYEDGETDYPEQSYSEQPKRKIHVKRDYDE